MNTVIKPFFIDGKGVKIVYKGGTYNPELLKNNKRSSVKTLTRESLRNFCLTKDSFVNFKPTYYLKFSFVDFNEDVNFSYEKIKNVCKKIKKFSLDFKRKVPLFIWKKKFTEDYKIYYELITNFSVSPNIDKKFFYFLFNRTKDFNVSIEKIDALGDFYEVFFLDEYCNRIDDNYFYLVSQNFKDKKIGRLWGVINKSFYKTYALKKRNITKLNAEELERFYVKQSEINQIGKKNGYNFFFSNK